MKKLEFSTQFVWPELKSISGSNGINLIILMFIIFISLIAIGLGESANQYLKIKMDDPFIKFVKVNQIAFKKDVSVDDFSDKKLKSHYSFGEVSAVKIEYRSFKSTSGKEIEATLRLINESSEFYKFLESNNNILISNTIFRDNKYGCIVTKSFLEKLGYKNYNIDYINYINNRMDTRLTLPIPIAGVVTQLPDYADILISPTFYNAIKGLECLDIDNSNHKTYLEFYIPNNDKIPKVLASNGFDVSDKDELLFNNGIIIIKNGIEDYNQERNMALEAMPNMVQFYDYARLPCTYNRNSEPEYFSFSFNSLDSIIPFKHYILKNHGLKIDMRTIESKENFNFFNKLSTLLSLSLMGFSIFSIFIFTTNLINNHIDKNKKNLGTLKAFGLSNNSVITIYTLISALLILIAFSTAFLLSKLFGGTLLDLIVKISNISIENGITFNNIDFIYLVLSFIIIPLIAISLNIRIKLKNATPGDLIYNR